MKYKFILKYTNDEKHEKVIRAADGIEAWKLFSEWVVGYIVLGKGTMLESVKVKQVFTLE